MERQTLSAKEAAKYIGISYWLILEIAKIQTLYVKQYNDVESTLKAIDNAFKITTINL